MYEFLQRLNPAAAQDFSVGGRVAWATYCRRAGMAAMESGDLPRAVSALEEAIYAFPFPRSLELLGECLLLEGRPVEAAVYLAAAVGMGGEDQFRPLFLLGKALAAANDNYVSKMVLQRALSIAQDDEALKLLDEVRRRSTGRTAGEGR
jgi:tetratricopeptide (TPR) repeat protein